MRYSRWKQAYNLLYGNMLQNLIKRIRNKINRTIRERYRKNVPYQKETTFVGQERAWYEPLLAGASTFIEDCSSAKTASGVLDILGRLTPDSYVEFSIQYYQTGIQRFGNQWKYADINTVLYGICKNVEVETYMEIGVRRGRSMSVVAALHPHAKLIGFDMWIPNYVGIENPGPDFVHKELERVGYKEKAIFIVGDSKQTVPKYFKDNTEAYFDIITVDGDHTASGAMIDLKNVIPRLKIGGFLVFDDISNPDHMYLKDVWDRVIVRSNRFTTYSFEELGYGVAFGIKKY